MRTTSHTRWLVFGLMLAFGFTPAVARAQSADITIPAGTDYLYTQPGTYANIPGVGTVPLMGNPIYPGETDTIVQRLADADATTGAPISTMLTGLSLESAPPYPPGFVTVTLDPALASTGTMSFAITTPIVPGTEIGGTISDTLTVNSLVSIIGAAPILVTENFTSSGRWQAFLPDGSNEVTNFQVIIDTHVDPVNGVHIVSSFPVPEPSTWIMLVAAGLIVPACAARRGRRRA